jgi:hypothetical protein
MPVKGKRQPAQKKCRKCQYSYVGTAHDCKLELKAQAERLAEMQAKKIKEANAAKKAAYNKNALEALPGCFEYIWRDAIRAAS